MNAHTPDDAKYKNEQWLRMKYEEEDLKQTEISDICGVAIGTIGHWIDKFGIERKSQTELQTDGEVDDSYRDEEWLRSQYFDEEKSLPTIAKECGVSYEALYEWAYRFEFDMRTPSESQTNVMKDPERRKLQSEAISGENHPHYGKFGRDHPAYQGGTKSDDFRQGQKWKRFRVDIYKRDNLQCQWCGGYGKLHAHHIVEVSKGGAKYDDENLITLCADCHWDVHSADSEVFFAC